MPAFGDSFTLGVGADDPARDSYPIVAARILSELRPEPLALSNRARPGLNSTEIVAEFESVLLHSDDPRPLAALLLAGVNNERWLRQSGQFCLEDGQPPPRLRDSLRTYGLLRWVVLRVRPPRPVDQACREVSIGFDHLERGRPDEALRSFERAVVLDSSSAWAHLGCGIALARAGLHAEAVGAYRRVLDEGSRSPSLDLALAWSLRAIGEGEEARQLALEAEQVEYLRDMAVCLLGWLAFDEGLLDSAEESFRAAGHLDGVTGPPAGGGVVPFALDGLGWIALKRGQSQPALERFRECHRVGEDVHVTPHLLGWCHVGEAVALAGLGAHTEALAALKIARADASTKGGAMALEGWINGAPEVGSCEKARWRFGTALATVPDQPWALRGQALCDEVGPSGHLPPLGVLFESALLSSLAAPAMTSWVDPGDTRLLEADLLRAAELARSSGIPLYLLVYPQPDAHPELERAIQRAGGAAGVPVIDPRPSLEAELRSGTAWEDLFVADGHPTTRGYRLIGEEVARVLTGQR